jgi:hypothetical protein
MSRTLLVLTPFFRSFEPLEGLVYPDFARCVVASAAPPGKPVGGIGQKKVSGPFFAATRAT